MTAVGAEARAASGSDARLVRRLAEAYRLLEQRRALAERLRLLVERLDRAKLFPVAGQRWLLDRLELRLREAGAALDELAGDGAAAPGDGPVGRLEAPLHSVEWAVADSAAAALDRQCTEQDAVVRTLTEDLGTHRLWFDRYRRELTSAMDVGAPLNTVDTALLTELDSRIRRADQDAGQGRFDTVAIALRTARQLLEQHGLWEAQAFEERIGKIAEGRIAVERREAVMTRRAELFLIAAPHTGPDGERVSRAGAPVEYRVLLRRPSFESTQETNLHDMMRIDDEDRRQFSATVDELAEAASAGVRAVVPASAQPPPAAERTRGILGQAQRALDEHPAERLERIGRLMYSLLIPDAMQRLIDETTCPLTITSNDLELPWELMHDGDDFLSLKRPFARMPVGQTFPRRSRRTVPTTRAMWNVLLVHSDPGGDLAESAREIEEIEETLQQLPVRVNTELLTGENATGDALTRHLSSGQYDLIHYAGHAGFDAADPARSFLLLHRGQRFHAERIQRVLEGRPIVFLNACDTSRAHNEDGVASTGGIVARAQGLASAFVYGGAQACVGTLWPVFDDTARTLAASFYTRLLTRQRVGEALCEARATSRTLHTDRLTWAAYALYGDPLYRLREGAPASQVPATIGTGTG